MRGAESAPCEANNAAHRRLHEFAEGGPRGSVSAFCLSVPVVGTSGGRSSDGEVRLTAVVLFLGKKAYIRLSCCPSI